MRGDGQLLDGHDRWNLTIIGGRKDAGTHRAVLGFADKHTAQQIGKTVEDLSPHEWAEHRDEIKQDGW